MAIKNLFARGIGFGEPRWIVTRGFGADDAEPTEPQEPSQTATAPARELTWTAPRR